MNVIEEIKNLLDKNNISYKIFEHEPTPTSEIAAKVRGTPLERGAKALVLRSEGNFLMCVLPANRKLSFRKVKEIIRSRKLSFATPEEVKKVTNCVVGGVPPFGNLFNIPLYIDKNLLNNETIDFNAGLQTVSIEIGSKDLVRTSRGILMDITE